MKSKLDTQTQQRLKTLLSEMTQQGLCLQQIQQEVQNLMSELGGEAEAAAQRADQILDMIRNRPRPVQTESDTERLKKFLAKLEQNETRH